MRFLNTVLVFIGMLGLIVVLSAGCSKKPETKPVAELETYKDPFYTFEIGYPKDWSKNLNIGKAYFYSSKEAEARFYPPYQVGELGARIMLKVDSAKGKSLSDCAKDLRDSLKSSGWTISGEQPTTLGGVEAVKIAYAGKVEAQTKTTMYVYQILAVKDSLLNTYECAGFNQMFNAYVPAFDSVYKTVKLASLRRGTTSGAGWTPSESLEKYTQSNFFEFSYPDNFEFTSPKKGSYDFVMETKAYRQDCTLHADVFGAKGLTVEKVVDQNKGTYKGTPVETRIDGNKAFYINYAPGVPQIKSRVYFVVKNDKVIRITLNWYQPQSEMYLGAFEKCIASMRLK
jgi:hypothetical protein